MFFSFLNSIDFFHYWGKAEMHVNIIIVLNLLGSMILGMCLGYERIFQGRAAGMRTYSLVCLASCALTVFNGYSQYWFGGQYADHLVPLDPTRTIQGIVTGVGFLGAGVIMKEGMTISGLSTAASIWLCSAIGILVGVGFYFSAISLTFLAIIGMLLVASFEHYLPQKKLILITLKFKKDFNVIEENFIESNLNRGYVVSPNSLSIVNKNGETEWTYMAYSINKNHKAMSIPNLSNEIASFDGVESFTITPVRN